MIEIDRDANIYIEGESAGDIERFVAAFNPVWESIPLDDKEPMIQHWKIGFAGTKGLMIQLDNNYDLPAVTDNNGNCLFFNSLCVNALCHDFLKLLIAHELGHVYHFADKQSAHHCYPPDNNAKEDEADTVAKEWGYDVGPLREWSNVNVETLRNFGINIQEGCRWQFALPNVFSSVMQSIKAPPGVDS